MEPIYLKESEESLCSYCFLDKDALKIITKTFNENDFLYPETKELYSAIFKITEEGKEIDINLILEVIGNGLNSQEQILEVISKEFSLINLDNTIGIVKTSSLKRKIKNTFNSFLKNLDNYNSLEFDKEFTKTLDKLKKLESASLPEKSVSLTQAYIEFMVNLEKNENKRLFFDYPVLDNIINGISNGNLVVIGARPAVGKTTFLVNLASNLSLKIEGKILFFSCEMSTEELSQTFISRQARISKRSIQDKVLTIEENDKMMRYFANKHITDRVEICDKTSTIEDLCNISRIASRDQTLKLIMVDYLQLLTTKRNFGNKEQIVSYISNNLKMLAKELEVPIIVLSQLNRNSVNREDKVPTLSDLRDSGAIEQDADSVMLIHRDSYHNKDQNEKLDNSVTQVIVAKNRHGKTGTSYFNFYMNYCFFKELTENEAFTIQNSQKK